MTVRLDVTEGWHKVISLFPPLCRQQKKQSKNNIVKRFACLSCQTFYVGPYALAYQ